MALPDLSNVRWRNLASFGAIGGGTALACATGGVPATIALGLASVFGNIAAGDAAKKWDERLRDPKYAHPNHDLTRLVGRAIARAFYLCTDDRANKAHARWMRAMGEEAEASYSAVAEHPAFDKLASRNLPNLFEAAAGEDGNIRLDDVDWPGLIEFIRRKAKQPKQPGAVAVVAAHLTESAYGNIREMFKRDFAGDGRAFPALCIDMNGQVLARLGEVARDQKTTLTRLEIQSTDLLAIRSLLESKREEHRSALSPEQAAGLAGLFDEFPKLSKTLDDVLYEVWQIGERTGRMEVRQIDDSSRLERIEHILLERFADKKPGDDPTQQQLPPELIEQAQLLSERGSQEQQAVAEIALKHHAQADAIIQQLKQQPLAEAHRLLSLEGDNWYQAGEFDKAIDPYEKAMALRPDDFTSRNNATLAYAQARLENIGAHRQRAIEVAEGTLKMLPVGSTEWAATQNNLGNAWWNKPEGDKGENMDKAINAYVAALTVYSKDCSPIEWAATQNNLGAALADHPRGDKVANINRAIVAFKKALVVRTKGRFPDRWAQTHYNLASALAQLAELRPDRRCDLLRRAIASGKAALSVRTKDAFPHDHAGTLNDLQMDRQAYESAGCSEQVAFEDIEPAE